MLFVLVPLLVITLFALFGALFGSDGTGRPRQLAAVVLAILLAVEIAAAVLVWVLERVLP